jgi:hypothetical protein
MKINVTLYFIFTGVLMWEVFTCGDMPYREKRNVDVVDYVVTQGKRLQKPTNTPMIIYQVMMRCWDKVCMRE